MQEPPGKTKRFSGLSSFFSSFGGKNKDGSSGKTEKGTTKTRPFSGGVTKLPAIQSGQAMVSQSAPAGEGGKGKTRSPAKGSEVKGYRPKTFKQFV